jgi:hypothetical protein
MGYKSSPFIAIWPEGQQRKSLPCATIFYLYINTEGYNINEKQDEMNMRKNVCAHFSKSTGPFKQSGFEGASRP